MTEVGEGAPHAQDLERTPFEILNGDYSVELRKKDGLVVTWKRDGRIIPVTWRSIQDYEGNTDIPRGFIQSARTLGLQVVEVGAGLAEFIPELALHQERRPIVIEPIDYRRLIDMLSEASSHELIDSDRALVSQVVKRARIYADPRLVRLYPVGIEKIKRYKELRGIADVVIDVVGGLIYTGEMGKWREYIDYLLKDDPPGKFYHSYHPS